MKLGINKDHMMLLTSHHMNLTTNDGSTVLFDTQKKCFSCINRHFTNQTQQVPLIIKTDWMQEKTKDHRNRRIHPVIVKKGGEVERRA